MKCGRPLDPEWATNDENFREFFQRVQDVEQGEDLGAFLADCAKRERAGRAIYGYAYLTRDNCAEGFEEAADGGNYAYFEKLRAARAGIEDPDLEAELVEAAVHFARAHRALARARYRLSYLTRQLPDEGRV